MITIENFLNTVGHRISGGSEYQWECFGPDARYLDSEFPNRYSASIVFDTLTQVVYEATVCDYSANRAYRWLNPDFKSEFEDEVLIRGAQDQAWDNVGYIDLDVPEDWLTKARAIVIGESYDTRVSVPLEMSDDEMLRLMTMAHERDITLNQLVEQILTQAIQARKAQT
jgi:hypothetical protein